MGVKINILNLSSLFLLLPFFKSLTSNHTNTFKYGLGLVNIMAQIYHATYWPIIRKIDMIVVHYMVGYHLYSGFICNIITLKVLIMYVCILYAIMTYWIFRLSKK